MAESTVEIGRSLGLSPQSRMVNGYSGKKRTLVEMDGIWKWTALHPFMKRLHLAAYFSDPRTARHGFDADGLAILDTPLGVGSAGRSSGEAARRNFWSRNSRTYLPGRPSRNTPEGRAWLKPGYAGIAYPGTSNHEDDTFEGYCMAVDNVGWNTHPWFNAHVGDFGLRDFRDVGSEPWHTQLAGYGASKSALQRDLANRGLPTVDLPPIPLAATPAPPPKKDREIMMFMKHPNDRHLFAVDVRHVDGPTRDQLIAVGVTERVDDMTDEQLAAFKRLTAG